jgi:hypothetical protein
MVTKQSSNGSSYEIDGRRFIWHPEPFEGEETLPDVVIPLRIKMGLVLDIAGQELDNSVIATMFERIIPAQMDVVREMDVNDCQEMFTTWQADYNALTGASLGESSGSSA